MSGVMAALLSVAALVLVVGLAARIWVYASVPAPLRIATMPAPLTRGGVALRILREIALFESLFRADKLLWIAAVLFHGGMLLVLLRHLRYFLEPVPWLVTLEQPFGVIGAFAMMVGLLALLARRLLLPTIRSISRAGDFALLLLLLAIGASGLTMTFLVHTDIPVLKKFVVGLLTLDWQAIPADPALIAHLTMVSLLMLVMPFSKLLHIPGIFFSPTRNQVDDARERRRVAAWARPLDAGRP